MLRKTPVAPCPAAARPGKAAASMARVLLRRAAACALSAAERQRTVPPASAARMPGSPPRHRIPSCIPTVSGRQPRPALRADF